MKKFSILFTSVALTLVIALNTSAVFTPSVEAKLAPPVVSTSPDGAIAWVYDNTGKLDRTVK